MKSALARGFTLVELLIVIALLGIIATIVIAAINPIEQANRAADAGMKADASQIVSAIDRYYASHNSFPWNAADCTGTNCVETVDAEFPFVSADDPAVGICGAAAADCKSSTTKGELLKALELQNTFLNKSWINNENPDGKLYVGKAQGSSSGVYVCWVPKANSNRQVLIASAGKTDKLLNIAGFTDAGVPQTGACTAVSGTGAEGWSSANCVECVPE